MNNSYNEVITNQFISHYMKYKYEGTLELKINYQYKIYECNLIKFTCKELKIAKIQANASVSLLIASIPMIQVTPSSGKRIIVAFSKFLQYIIY